MTKPDVVVVSGFLSREDADALLDRIRSEADFKQNYYKYMGKTGPRPRLEAWYGTWDYPYSPGTILKAAPIPGYLQEVIDRIREAGFGDYNAVLINRYRDGKDYISPHSDDDYGDPEPTIPSLTLGAARPFRLAKIISGSKLDKSTTVEFLAGHGDLVVMRGRTNAEWEHWVPKTAKPIEERINLTFRHKSVPETRDGKQQHQLDRPPAGAQGARLLRQSLAEQPTKAATLWAALPTLMKPTR